MFGRVLKSSLVINSVFVFFIFYFIFHLFNDNLSIQKYLVLEFENKFFEEKQRLINLKIESIDMDLFAMYAEKEDMYDELSKKHYPDPREGEVIIKID